MELRYTNGTMIEIDCLAVEDKVGRNKHKQSELDDLLNYDPVGYADLILSAHYFITKESRILLSIDSFWIHSLTLGVKSASVA